MQALKTSATMRPALTRSTSRGAAATPAAPLMPGAPRSLGRVLGGCLRAQQYNDGSSYPRYPPPPAYQPVEPSAPDLPPGTPAYGSSYGQSDYSASYAPSTVGPSEEEQAAALEQEELRKVAGYTRGLSHAAFWVQFALAIVSGGILLFSAAFVPRVTGVTASVFKWLTLAGVLAAFVSALFAHGFLRLSKKLQDGGVVGRGYLVTTLLTNNAFCLGGIAITVIGLQASVGTLVAKSLTTALAGPYQVSNASNAGLVSLDVFALQASTNTLLCHVIGLVFTNLMLRAVNKVVKPKAA